MGKTEKIYTPELTRSDLVTIMYALEDVISEYSSDDDYHMVLREKEVLSKMKDFMYNEDKR